MLSESRGAVRLALHVQPGAKRSAVTGVHGDALKVAIAAPPVDGKANEAVCIFVAELFELPARAVTIAAGASSRRKTVSVDGLSLVEAESRLKALLGAMK